MLNIISIISLMCFTGYFYIGLYIISLDKRSYINRLFFLMCMSTAFWALCAIFIYSAKEKEVFLWLFHFSTLGVAPFWALSAHFFVALTNLFRLHPLSYVLLYLPVPYIMYKGLYDNLLYKDFVKQGDYWFFIPDTGGLDYNIYLILITCYMLISVVSLIGWRIKSETIKGKKISSIILVSFAIFVILGNLEEVILPEITSFKSLGLAPILLFVLMFGIGYSINKYRFLSVTPELVSDDIIKNIDESIILLEPDLSINFFNTRTENIINRKLSDLKTKSLSRIFVEYETLQLEIKKMIESDYMDFACRVHYLVDGDENILMDVKASKLNDKFGDLIGIMIMGSAIREISTLKVMYKLTDRQADIVQNLISGQKNKEIGKVLGLTERTVKGHITTIYNKLNVTNKIELINLLKDYNLIPERKAERMVLIPREDRGRTG